MKELDKLRVILPHWIEHNAGHGNEFINWAETMKDAGETEIAALLHKAGAILQDADAVLRDALTRAGGEMPPKGGHNHHHHTD